MTQTYLDTKPDKTKITIMTETGRYKVQAPLPDDFGFTAGSEYTFPFDSGGSSDILQKLKAVTGISQKLGIRIKKMYANPEPSEISFEMEFVAYYSATEEVLIPVIKLFYMALGTTITYEDGEKALENLAKLLSKGVAKLNDVFELSVKDPTPETEELLDALSESDAKTYGVEYGNRIAELIGFIQGPEKVKIKFGNVYTIKSAYVSSVAVQFSKALDPTGIPMSAKCTVTCTTEKYIIANDILEMFKGKVSL